MCAKSGRKLLILGQKKYRNMIIFGTNVTERYSSATGSKESSACGRKREILITVANMADDGKRAESNATEMNKKLTKSAYRNTSKNKEE